MAPLDRPARTPYPEVPGERVKWRYLYLPVVSGVGLVAGIWLLFLDTFPANTGDVLLIGTGAIGFGLGIWAYSTDKDEPAGPKQSTE